MGALSCPRHLFNEELGCVGSAPEHETLVMEICAFSDPHYPARR